MRSSAPWMWQAPSKVLCLSQKLSSKNYPVVATPSNSRHWIVSFPFPSLLFQLSHLSDLVAKYPFKDKTPQLYNHPGNTFSILFLNAARSHELPLHKKKQKKTHMILGVSSSIFTSFQDVGGTWGSALTNLKWDSTVSYINKSAHQTSTTMERK